MRSLLWAVAGAGAIFLSATAQAQEVENGRRHGKDLAARNRHANGQAGTGGGAAPGLGRTYFVKLTYATR